MTDPFPFLGLRAIGAGPVVPPPPPPCTWVVGDWVFKRQRGRLCLFERTVVPSVKGCAPTDIRPAGAKYERC